MAFCRPTYGKIIMQAMIEFVNSNSVIPEQLYKHRLEYKGKRLFVKLKIACHNACILKIYKTGSSLNLVCVDIFIKHCLLSLF